MYLLRKNDVIRYAHNEVAREFLCNSLLAMKRCLPYNVAKPHFISASDFIGQSPLHLPARANIILMMYLLRKNDVIRYAHNDVARELQSNSLLAMKRCLPYNVAKPHFISASDFIGRSPLLLPKANIISKRHSFECLFDQPQLSAGFCRERSSIFALRHRRASKRTLCATPKMCRTSLGWGVASNRVYSGPMLP